MKTFSFFGLRLLPIICITLSLGQETIAQIPVFLNAGSINGDSTESCLIATDSKGSVYIVGYYNSTSLSFSNTTTTLTNSGKNNIYIAKYDTIGNLIWAKNFGGNYAGSPNNLISNMALDNNGNIFIAGNFIDTLSFGNNTLTSPGNSDGYIAKVNKDGSLAWAKQIGDTAEYIADFSIDRSGNLLVCGSFQSATYTLGTQILNEGQPNTGNLFYAKFDNNGIPIWGKTPSIYSQGAGTIAKIKPSPDGKIILYGGLTATGQLSFLNSNTLLIPNTVYFNYVTAPTSSTYLTSIDLDGNTLAQQVLSQPNPASPFNLYVAKNIYPFDDVVHTSLDWYYEGRNLFKINPTTYSTTNSTELDYYQQSSMGGFNNGAYRQFYDHIGDSVGNIYIVGENIGQYDYYENNGGPLWGKTFFELFQLDSNLENLTAIGFNNYNSVGESVTIDTVTNTLYIAGAYQSTNNFIAGLDTLVSSYNNSYDVFFIKTRLQMPFTDTSIHVSLGADTAICYGSSINLGQNLTVSGGQGIITYSWNPATGLSSTNIANPSATPLSSTTYILTITEITGAVATDTINIIVDSIPVPVITPSGSISICSGDSITLSSSPAYRYLWSNGDTLQDIKVSIGGEYTLTVSYLNQRCTAVSSPTTIIVNPNPPVPIITANPSANLCEGSYTTLSTQYSFDYITSIQWSNGKYTNNPTCWIDTPGDYTLTVVDAEGCSAVSNTISIVAAPNPPVPKIIASPSTTVCEGDSITLYSPSASSYQWSNGDTTQTIVVNTTGNYTVTVGNIQGCTTTSLPAWILINAPPPLPLITRSGDSIISNATSGNQWYLNDTLLKDATQQLYIIKTPVNYSQCYNVIDTNSFGCSSKSNIVCIDTLGIVGNSQNTKGITIVPNPAISEAIIYFNQILTNANILIFDGNGRKVLSVYLNGQAYSSYKVETTNLATGIYSVIVKTDTGNYSTHLVIIK